MYRKIGEVVALRYITTDQRIEMAWATRVVQDTDELLALFIAAGSAFKAGPKLTAASKVTALRPPTPPDEYVWRNDTLRLMFPGARHSVWLFWDTAGGARRFLKYFVNLEEPFRRTAAGFDTQDHTLDVVVTPELQCSWRDEAELESHTALGFYTPALAAEVRAEGQRAIDAIVAGTHPCLRGWTQWRPESEWSVPAIPSNWSTTPATLWERRHWAYGNAW